MQPLKWQLIGYTLLYRAYVYTHKRINEGYAEFQLQTKSDVGISMILYCSWSNHPLFFRSRGSVMWQSQNWYRITNFHFYIFLFIY